MLKPGAHDNVHVEQLRRALNADDAEWVERSLQATQDHHHLRVAAARLMEAHEAYLSHMGEKSAAWEANKAAWSHAARVSAGMEVPPAKKGKEEGEEGAKGGEVHGSTPGPQGGGQPRR